MKRFVSHAALILAMGAAAPHSFAAAYYFDSAASSSGFGSLGNPWNSLAPANSLTLNPGDALYLRGSFNGGLRLDAADSGTRANPVTITSWGSAPATINAGDGYGINASNVSGVSVSNLNIFGSGPKSVDSRGNYTNTVDGIRFYTDTAKQNHIRIDNVKVAGFGENGINIRGGNGSAGFNDVKITNSSVYNNQRAGLNVDGDFYNSNRDAHTNVVITRVKAYDNPGRATSAEENHSGNGIVIGQVNGGVIQNSKAWGNGTKDASKKGGSVGIWAWDSNKIVIQHNESFKNGTAGHHDGGGFDLDGGVTNSVMQYNYAHDNAGAGFLLAQFKNAKKFEGNLVANNISENDGRKNGYGAIHAFGEIHDTEVRDNIVYLEPAEKGLANTRGEAPAAIKLRGGQYKDIDFSDNLLIIRTDGDSNLLQPTMFANTGNAKGFTLGENNEVVLDGGASSADLAAITSTLAKLGNQLSSGKIIALDAGSMDQYLARLNAIDPAKPVIVIDEDVVRDVLGSTTPAVVTSPTAGAGNVEASVPEPSALALMSVAGAALLRRRRHRAR